MKGPVVLSSVAAGVLLGGLVLAQSTPPTRSLAQPDSGASLLGQHTMTGEVTSVSPDKGRLHVKTAEGRMLLQFPPSALQSVQRGDSVTIDLTLRDNGPAPNTK